MLSPIRPDPLSVSSNFPGRILSFLLELFEGFPLETALSLMGRYLEIVRQTEFPVGLKEDGLPLLLKDERDDLDILEAASVAPLSPPWSDVFDREHFRKGTLATGAAGFGKARFDKASLDFFFDLANLITRSSNFDHKTNSE